MEDVIFTGDIKDEMIYDLAGYLLKSRDSVWAECADCKKGLITKYEDLPSDFMSAELTASRNYGGLTFVTVNFFKIVKLVEQVIEFLF